MRRAKGIVFALRPLGETRKAAALPDRPDAVAPAGEDLVRVGLMADIPDQPVVRRVEDIVERNRELDDAETGAEMAAGDRDGVDQFAVYLQQRRPRLLRGALTPGASATDRGRFLECQ